MPPTPEGAPRTQLEARLVASARPVLEGPWVGPRRTHLAAYQAPARHGGRVGGAGFGGPHFSLQIRHLNGHAIEYMQFLAEVFLESRMAER